MPIRDQLTKEKFKGICKSNFELVSQAIRLGRSYLLSGQHITVDELLDEIQKNPQVLVQESPE